MTPTQATDAYSAFITSLIPDDRERGLVLSWLRHAEVNRLESAQWRLELIGRAHGKNLVYACFLPSDNTDPVPAADADVIGSDGWGVGGVARHYVNFSPKNPGQSSPVSGTTAFYAYCVGYGDLVTVGAAVGEHPKAIRDWIVSQPLHAEFDPQRIPLNMQRYPNLKAAG